MPKPISRPLHGLADYSYVSLVAAAPELVGFNESAARLCRVFSAGVLLASLFTRAEWGMIRVVPYRVHLALDFSSGLLALAAPWLFGFADDLRARSTFLAMGVSGVVVPLLSEPEEMPGLERQGRRA